MEATNVIHKVRLFRNFISNVHLFNFLLILFESINFRELFITFIHSSINIIFNHNSISSACFLFQTQNYHNIHISTQTKTKTSSKKKISKMLKQSFTTLFLFQTLNYFLQAFTSQTKTKPSSKKRKKKISILLSSLIQIKPKIIKPPTTVSQLNSG